MLRSLLRDCRVNARYIKIPIHKAGNIEGSSTSRPPLFSIHNFFAPPISLIPNTRHAANPPVSLHSRASMRPKRA
jgi:hypothetical protein